MHELSIALSIVEAASEEAARRGVAVGAVHLRVGALSGVVVEALRFSFDLACEGTPLEGSRLAVEEVPVRVFCPSCRAERASESIQLLRCVDCRTLTSDVVSGRELELYALEIRDEQKAASG